MQYIVTYQLCPQCGGTGQQYTGGGTTGSGPFPCTWPGCLDGTEDGYIEVGRTKLDPGLGDLEDKIDDIMDKCNDIKEVVDGL